MIKITITNPARINNQEAGDNPEVTGCVIDCTSG